MAQDGGEMEALNASLGIITKQFGESTYFSTFSQGQLE